MNRRQFIGSTGVFVAGACAVPEAWQDEAATISQVVEAYYEAFRGSDTAKYRALLTDDCMLLENGDVMDVAGDVAFMASHGRNYQRADACTSR